MRIVPEILDCMRICMYITSGTSAEDQIRDYEEERDDEEAEEEEQKEEEEEVQKEQDA